VEHSLCCSEGALSSTRAQEMLLIFSLQSILAQIDRDNRINQLVEVIDDVYSFVTDADMVKKIESQRKILVVMAQQTTECAYFIRDYAIKGFCRLGPTVDQAGNSPLFSGKRTIKNTFNLADDKIKAYEDKFKELKIAFQDRAVLHTEISVLRTETTVLSTEIIVSRILGTVESFGKHFHQVLNLHLIWFL
jgi:hypothetical protein